MYFINNINIYQFNRFHELPWSRALFLPERKKMHNDKYVQLYEANSFRVIMRKASFAKMYTNTNWHFHDYNKWCLKSNLFVAQMVTSWLFIFPIIHQKNISKCILHDILVLYLLTINCRIGYLSNILMSVYQKTIKTTEKMTSYHCTIYQLIRYISV